jgi:DNA polymerase zeta
LDGKEENKCFPERHHTAQQTALGVPTHFKNDGSVLYLLTQVFSPPSPASVSQWLVQEGKQNIRDDQIDHNSPQKRCITNSKIDASESSSEMKENMSSEVKEKEANVTGSGNEFSQISGPDDKGKLTPLSQIGFRDPASVGGGQQLTIFSLEVYIFLLVIRAQGLVPSSYT